MQMWDPALVQLQKSRAIWMGLDGLDCAELEPLAIVEPTLGRAM